MKKKDGNVVHSFPDIWDTFLAFESVSRSQDESLDDFLGRWQENMCSAQSTGCDFSDTFLACKLLQKVNLDQNVLKKIVNSLAGTKSELLYKLLSKLDDFLGDKSQRDEAQISDQAEHVGEELEKETTGTSKRIKLSEEDLPLSVKVKHETSEAPKPLAQMDFSNLLDKMQDLADDIEEAGSVSQNDSQVNKCLEMDPLDTEGDHVPDVPENILTDSEQEDNEMPAEVRRENDHLANKKDVTDNSMVDEDMEDEHSRSLQPVEKILEELEFDVKEEGFDEFPLFASIHSNQPIQSFIKQELTGQMSIPSFGLFNCAFCETTFLSEKKLHSHIKISHCDNANQLPLNGPPFQCPCCSFTTHFTNSLIAHNQTHTERPFKCPACPQTFSLKNNLEAHYRQIHANDQQSYNCYECSYKAEDEKQLILHMFILHRGQQPFKCLICMKTFASKESTNKHMVLSHADEEQQLFIMGPPYECPECAFSTNSKYTLISHHRIHTGSKSFKCGACDKVFKDKFQMKAHYNKCHSKELTYKARLNEEDDDFVAEEAQELIRQILSHPDEEPFKCSFCETTFASEDLMNNHIKYSHTDYMQQLQIDGPPFHCPECNFNTMAKHRLMSHLRSHSGEKSFKCPDCPKIFTRKEKMKLHHRKCHAEEPPFKCKRCDFEAEEKHLLISHMDSHKQELIEEEDEKRHTNGQTYKGTQSSYEADDDQKLTRHMLTALFEQPFKCSFCETTFASEELMNSHIKVSHSDNVPQLHMSGPPYQCSHCDFITQYKFSIVAHIRTHTGERPFKCPACPKGFTTKERMKTHHRRWHTNERPHKCTLCNYASVEKNELTVHMYTHTGERPFECTFCDKTFTSKKYLNKHIRISHADEELQTQNIEALFKCTQCDFKATEKLELTRHLLVHVEDQPCKCPYCDHTFKSGDLMNRHIKSSHNDKEQKTDTNGQAYKCTLCSYEAEGDHELASHMSIHADEQRFKCSFCGTNFDSEELMNNHIKISHTDAVQNLPLNGPPFQCPTCSFSTQYKNSLIAHFRTHTGERPFKCPACPKGFTTKEKMKTHHRRWHTSERPYKCTQCDYGAVENYELTLHMYTHTGEKPFECSFCEKSFTSRKYLNKHMKTLHGHEGSMPTFECPDCSFTSRYKHTLISHIRSHTGEKPFKCPECSKAFRMESKMLAHLRAHGGEQTFKCRFCEETFTEKKARISHVKTMHSESLAELNDENEQGDNGIRSDIKDENVPKVDKKSQCEFCGVSVDRKYMKKHQAKCLRSEDGETVKPIRVRKKKVPEKMQCEHCGNNYASHGGLKAHYGICPNLGEEERKAKGYKKKRDIRKKVKCEVCCKMVKGAYYVHHMSLHSDKRDYRCDICPRAFTSSYFLSLHKYRHFKGKAHHCDTCKRDFKESSELKRHIMREHTKERPFECPHCSYKTLDRPHLKRHLRSHTGETPFKCNLCGKLYRDKKSVKRHLTAHHGYFDEKDIGRNPVSKPEEEKFAET